MSDLLYPTWRDALRIVVDSIKAEKFKSELSLLREEYEDDPDLIGMIYTVILTRLFVTAPGLFAALQLPSDQVPAALAEIRETLTNLDFNKERKRLKRGERRYYDAFVQFAAPAFADVGEAMEALFNCYVAGDYDPETDPNALIAEALEIAEGEDDLERARRLITQAGAIALHSHPLWWRWRTEAYGPAESWLVTIVNLVEGYTGSEAPLGPLEEARAEAERNVQKALETVQEHGSGELADTSTKLSTSVSSPSPVDDLIEELIEQSEEHFAPEQLELCRAHRAEAIPALMVLAGDEYLQMEDAPGEGYAPIHAVELLGELEAVEAVPALIDIVADSDPEEIIFSTAIHALEEIGPPALEEALTFMRYSWDVETKTALADVVSEVGQRDERAYETLVAVWEEAAWEEGKCLLAYPLALTGGEQAIPLLEAALEDPDLDGLMDYNEIADALEVLGVEAPRVLPDLPLLDTDVGALMQSVVLDLGEPEHLATIADIVPEEWRAHPDSLAHACTDAERARLNNMIAVQAISLPPEASAFLVHNLLEAVDMLTFDASTRDYPRWLRQAYTHLAECAGPDIQRHLTGVLLPLQHYLDKDYDIAADPDQLLSTAREFSPDDERLRQLFGQAGALVLHSRSVWPRWPAETDQPLSGWLEGLIEFRRPLERIGQIPLRLFSDPRPEELSGMLMEALVEEEVPPPAVAELLDTIFEQGQNFLSPAQRRRFAHQRTAIIPHLIRIVEDERYWYDEEPGEGWAPILAVRLLGELKANQAADTLVSVVAESAPDDIVYDAALFGLMGIGPSAIPAVQAYLRYGRDVETKTALAEVLGRVGRRSPDTFDLLRQVWEDADWSQNRRTVALAFGDLRDRRAIPLLQAVLEDRAADVLDQSYVYWALRQLGAPSSSPPVKVSSRLKALVPYNPRLIYDDVGAAHRLKFSAWGEPLCPECGQPLVQSESGEWVHPPKSSSRHAASSRTRRRRKKKRR
jgi:HEAT repeat protein